MAVRMAAERFEELVGDALVHEFTWHHEIPRNGM